VEVFSKEVCDLLVEELRAMHPARWFFRNKILSRPTKGTTDAHYYFLGDKQQPAEFNALIRSMAPKIEGTELGEALFNRYDVGSFMAEHIDLAQYRYNMVIPLCDNGDGLFIGDTFVVDEPGRATVFPAWSPPHEVPPVKHQRFILIYLYE
jgi:hypothetical protein